MIDGMATAVESRSVQQSAEFLDDNYSDERHPSRRAAVQSLLLYLRGHSNIHLFTHIRSITVDAAGDRANAVVMVATAGVPVESVDVLISVKADLYRFDIEAIRIDDVWRIAKARWQRADLSDLTSSD